MVAEGLMELLKATGAAMAKDELTGNMPTEKMVDYFSEHKVETGIDRTAFNNAMQASRVIFH